MSPWTRFALVSLVGLALCDLAWSQDAPSDAETSAAQGQSLRRKQAPARTVGWVGAGIAITGSAALGLYTVDDLGASSSSSSIDPGYSASLGEMAAPFGAVLAPVGTVMLGSAAMANAGALRRGGVEVPNGLGVASVSLGLGTTALIGVTVATNQEELAYVAAATGIASTVTGIAQLATSASRLRSVEEQARSERRFRAGIALLPPTGAQAGTLLFDGAF